MTMGEFVLDTKGFKSDQETPHSTYAMIVGMGVLVGIVANFLLYQRNLGINLFILVLFTVVVAFALLYVQGNLAFRSNLLFVLPAVIFAFAIFWRSSELLSFFNLLAVFGCLLLFARFGPSSIFLNGSWTELIVSMVELFIGEWAVAPIESVNGLQKWASEVQTDNKQRALAGAILRGLVLTIPVLILFGVLLTSADAVFNDFVSDLLSWVKLDRLDKVIVQAIIILFFTWIAIVGFKLLLVGPFSDPPQLLTDYRHRSARHLGMIETGMLLVGVNVMFLLFVAIQARYFFGGESNITLAGYTYAEYARRGFFELVIVAMLSFGLITLLNAVVKREGTQERFFQVLTLILIALTLVMMVSAFRRLSLYEEAYGYTRTRVISHLFILWLGLLFACLAAELVLQRGLLRYGVILFMVGYLLMLNVINLEGFVARHNVERLHRTGKIDVGYLSGLSYDVVPSMITLLDDPDLRPQLQPYLYERLGGWLYELDRERKGDTLLDAHYSEGRAWDLLDQQRDRLEPFVRPYQ